MEKLLWSEKTLIQLLVLNRPDNKVKVAVVLLLDTRDSMLF